MTEHAPPSTSDRTIAFAAALQPLLERCIPLLKRGMEEEFADHLWLKMYHDYRYYDFSDGSGTCGSRIVFADGTKTFDFSPPTTFTEIMLFEVGRLRIKFQDVAWYGILFQLDREGKVDISYDYDPKCAARLTDDQEAGIPF